MNAPYQTDDNDTKNKKPCSQLYFITHLILSFFACYLSWKCAGSNFNVIHFVLALICPHMYILWALATKGGCGLFDNTPNNLYKNIPFKN